MKEIKAIKPVTKEDQKGFTLVEVMLFLSVMGLVLLIAFNSVGGRTAQAQFNDSMRSMNNYINSEYNEFINGVKKYDTSCEYVNNFTSTATFPSSSASPGESHPSCLMFGKIIMFGGPDDTRLYVYDVVGRNIAPEDYGIPSCNATNLTCINPNVVPGSPEEYEILWGTERKIGVETSKFGTNVDDLAGGIGFFREPVNRNIVTYVFRNDADPADQTIYTTSNPKSVISSEAQAAFCYNGGRDQNAAIIVGDVNSESITTLSFEENGAFYDCS